MRVEKSRVVNLALCYYPRSRSRVQDQRLRIQSRFLASLSATERLVGKT